MGNLAQSQFVKPYYVDHLGCDGLSAADIGRSLGTSASKIRRKLEDRGFIDRIKSQGFQAIPTGLTNNSNGLEYTEYYLDKAAAKFFVGKYDRTKPASPCDSSTGSGRLMSEYAPAHAALNFVLCRRCF